MRFSKSLLLRHLELVDSLARQPCPRCRAGRWRRGPSLSGSDWPTYNLWDCTAECGFACLVSYDGEATAGCRLVNGRRTSTRIARIVRGEP